MGEYVSNEPLRQEYLRLRAQGIISLQELARRAGKDDSHVAAALGIHIRTEKGVRRRRDKVQYETAVYLAEALGLDPVDAGV